MRPPPFVPQALDPAAVIPQVDVLPVQVPAVRVPAVVQGAQPPAPDPVPVPVATSPVVLSDEAIAQNIAEFQYAQAHSAWHQDAVSLDYQNRVLAGSFVVTDRTNQIREIKEHSGTEKKALDESNDDCHDANT